MSGQGEPEKGSRGVTSNGKLEEISNFGIRSMFESQLYVGSEDLHLGLPLPDQDTYPDWVPKALRMPDLLYKAAEKGVEEGWVKKAPADARYEIRYGFLRSMVKGDAKCDECEEAKRRQMRNEAADKLINIGTAERYRRASLGYGIGLIAAVAGLVCIVSDTGPLVRFIFVCFPATFAYAFTESARTGM